MAGELLAVRGGGTNVTNFGERVEQLQSVVPLREHQAVVVAAASRQVQYGDQPPSVWLIVTPTASVFSGSTRGPVQLPTNSEGNAPAAWGLAEVDVGSALGTKRATACAHAAEEAVPAANNARESRTGENMTKRF